MKKLKRFLKVLVIIVAVWFIIGFIPPLKTTKNNEWLEYRETLNRPLISAHRGGSLLNPENTEMAFDYIVEHDLADIIEIDIRVTKDNKLVIIHDDTIDRVAASDYKAKKEENPNYKGTIFVNENNYEDLLKYNLGLNFTGRDYSNITIEEADELGLTIMLLEEFLAKYESYDIKVLIEIKDSGELAEFAADETIKLLDGKYNSWKKDAMIISFTDSVINYIADEYPE
jgi:glycerophosphoryl diester phosphodiesterase